MGKIKKFLKTTTIAAAIFAGYYMFYDSTSNYFINSFSQKKESFMVGVDFEAYKQKELLGINLLKQDGIAGMATLDTNVLKEDKTKNLEKKEIENWSYMSAYSITEWMNKFFSNLLSFTPYHGTWTEKDVKQTISERIQMGDEMVKDIRKNVDKRNKLLLRIRGEKKYYEKLQKKDPLTFVTKRLTNILEDSNKIIMEFEVPEDKNLEQHNKRIKMCRDVNEKLKIAVTLDKSEGYNEKTGIWDPEKNKDYWKDADIIILEDYFSKPSDLEKSIKKFKGEVKGKKKIFVRIVVGSKRINENKIKSLEAEVQEYNQLMKIAHKYADGVIADDTNGIWLYSNNSYDEGERRDTTKKLYKTFRKIKINP